MIKYNNIFFYILILLIFSPIISYFTVTLFNISFIGIERKIVFSYWFFFILFNFKTFKIPKFSLFLLLFILYKFILTQFGINSYEGYNFIDIIASNDFTVFMIITIVYNINFHENNIKKFIKYFIFITFLGVIATFIQIFDTDFLNAEYLQLKDTEFDNDEYLSMIFDDIYEKRRLSIFGYRDLNEIGLSYLPIFSILLGFLLIYKNRNILLIILSGAIISLFSNNRYVIVAFIMASLQIILIQKSKLKGVLKYVLFVTIGVIVFGFIFQQVGYDINDWLDKRIFKEESFEENTRYLAFINFLKFFSYEIWFGYGKMTKEIHQASLDVGSSQIHVGYLSALVFYGIIGCFFLFGFWYTYLKKLYLNAKKTNFWGAFLGFLIFLWANASLVKLDIFFPGIIFTMVFDKYFVDNFINNSIYYEQYSIK